MKGNIIHQKDLQSIVTRLTLLTDESKGLWGVMTANEMVCHLSDQLRLALGEKPILSKPTFLQRTIIKWITFYLLNEMPRKIETIKEQEQGIGKAGTPPTDFKKDRDTLFHLLDKFTQNQVVLQTHPFFGRITAAQWGRLVFMHIDYHLKQFGI